MTLGTQPRPVNSPPPLFAGAVQAHRRGDVREAARLYRASLQKEGEASVTLYHFGRLRLDQRRHEEAAKLFRRALKRDPRAAVVEHHLGLALALGGRTQEAIEAYRRALTVSPDLAETHNNLGHALELSGQLDEARTCYQRALSLKPGYVEALNNLGNVLHLLDRSAEAVPLYEQALAIQPNYLESLVNLGNVLVKLGRFEEALSHYRRALQIAPKDVEALDSMGRTLHLLDRGEEALTYWEQVLAIEPTHDEAMNSIGVALRELGRLDEAVPYFKRAIETAPRKSTGFYNLSLSRRFSADDRHMASMLAMEGRMRELAPEAEAEMRVALGKALADVGEFDASFGHYERANSVRRQALAYDEARRIDHWARIRSVFSSELMQAKAGLGHASDRPVFVLGMPRSGTTLIEQILASHPAAYGAGELPGSANAIGAINRDASPKEFPEAVLDLDGGTLRALGQGYLDALGKIAPPAAERVVDKMPTNFVMAGLIALMFPNARIVHTRRDLRDIAVSCYTILFATGQEHTYDLAELGRYLRDYVCQMEHWRRVLPKGMMLEVAYEDVTEHLEANARRIVQHCGLAWDDACLEFHRTERSVKTASVTQVRQPIYRSSVGRWRRYEKHLGPLLDAIGDAGGRSGTE